MLVTFFSSMCNLQAGGQAAKHSCELVKCFAFIYKTLNHMTDLNKLNKSQWWRKVYEACRTVNMGTIGAFTFGLLICSHNGKGTIGISCEWSWVAL